MTSGITADAIVRVALAVYKFHRQAERQKPRPAWLDDPHSRSVYEAARGVLGKALRA